MNQRAEMWDFEPYFAIDVSLVNELYCYNFFGKWNRFKFNNQDVEADCAIVGDMVR